MRIIGIDGGLDGGIVLLVGMKVEFKTVMPTIETKSGREFDISSIVRCIKDCRPDHIFLEKAQAMPGQGVTSMFSIGNGYGIMRGICAALYFPHTLVHSKTWQKVAFKDLPKTDTKVMSVLVASRHWPAEDWRATVRCRKPHHGLTDAANLAWYGSIALIGSAFDGDRVEAVQAKALLP